MTLGRLVTFGYRGLRESADVRDLLHGHGVSIVVDVRLNPWSNQRPFSAGTRKTIEDAGFRYVHERGLGNLTYKTGGIEIADLDAIESVLDELRGGGTVALMCACAEPAGCHRSVLVAEARRRLPGLRVAHLIPRGKRPGNHGGPGDGRDLRPS
jgi:uncharacterized protein (DUF488 family)